MSELIQGIHHITAMADNAQKNVDFYQGILGLRLVKKTVNFDAPDVYHLYYGDEKGLPGSIMTFFPYGEANPGRRGTGMVGTTRFSAPLESLGWWEERLKKYGVVATAGESQLGKEPILQFDDHDGLHLEIVFPEHDSRTGWDNGVIPVGNSLRGFYGVEILAKRPEKTIEILTEYLDHRLVGELGNRFRLAAADSPGNYVDIVHTQDGPHGTGGSGTVHHIAFATENRASQTEVRTKLQSVLNPTEIIDRNYFTSIYFREPGGVLFEVATRDPGFAVDESPESLGTALKLPQQYEVYRKDIETSLPKLAPAERNFP